MVAPVSGPSPRAMTGTGDERTASQRMSSVLINRVERRRSVQRGVSSGVHHLQVEQDGLCTGVTKSSCA